MGLAAHSDPVPDLVYLLNHLSATTVSAKAIKEWTNRDPILSKVRRYVMTGWAATASDEFKPYQLKVERTGCMYLMES